MGAVGLLINIHCQSGLLLSCTLGINGLLVIQVSATKIMFRNVVDRGLESKISTLTQK